MATAVCNSTTRPVRTVTSTRKRSEVRRPHKTSMAVKSVDVVQVILPTSVQGHVVSVLQQHPPLPPFRQLTRVAFRLFYLEHSRAETESEIISVRALSEHESGEEAQGDDVSLPFTEVVSAAVRSDVSLASLVHSGTG